MNDKKEKQQPAESSAEPLTKKVAKFSALIYLGLAITVVIVATVGIFNMSYDYDVDLGQISLPDMDISDISMPDFSLPDIDNSTDSPVNNEQSGVTDEIQSSDTSKEPPVIKYYCPVKGEIIKNYSMDALVFSQTMGDYRVHSGIDIAAEEGAEVYAGADGQVTNVYYDNYYGRSVEITHPDGIVSVYSNLDGDTINVKVGDTVTTGTRIGKIGDTSLTELADEAHLHFAVKVNGVNVNPLDYITEESKSASLGIK